MNGTQNLGKRVLLCPLAGIGYLLLTSLARYLGGLAAGARPVVNWFMPFDQLPMPVTLIAFVLLAVLGCWAGMLVQGVGCTLAAAVGGYAVNLPVDYSNGWPKNCPGGYLNGGMIELVFGIGSILLAATVELLVRFILRRREEKAVSAMPMTGIGRQV